MIFFILVAGSESVRKDWKEFVKDIEVIVWMVDSSANEARFQENSEALRDFLRLKVTKNIPVLFIANKQV